MKRNERRGNALDVFLILLLIFSLIGMGFSFWFRTRENTASGEEVQAVLVLEWKAISPEVIACLRDGDALYTAAGAYYGQLEGISFTGAEVTLLSNGSYCKGAWSENVLCDAELVVRVTGVRQNGSFLRAGQYAVPVGQSVELYSSLACVRATVKSLSFLR